MENLTYDDIFGRLVKSAFEGNMEGEIARINSAGEGYLNDYIKYASGQGEEDKVVFKVRDCETGRGCGEDRCQAACLFNAISRDEEGKVVIKKDYCSSCGECIKVCDYGCLVDKKEFVPLIRILQERTVPVYAIVAPAFAGQFGPDVTPGKLRAALKRLGFYGMVEVALFADMLTLKEALEFDINVRKEGDFVLTSCCCPMWVAMIRKVYKQLVPHISPSVSPMVACGRGVKKIHPEARVVFIGPCVAKKAEAKEEDVKDAVDAVLTFKELQQIFEAVGINPAELEDEPSEHSSEAGRIYARTGGVSQAVAATLQRIRPQRKIRLKAVQADGVRECKRMLEEALDHKGDANFYEGMGCAGGCVGGPQAVIDPKLGTEQVNRYGSQAANRTPADNPYVLELLKTLGYKEIDELLEGEKANMFIRNFDR
ncbi:MAG: [Fe-Fe] hydrogenase large subunit C-terminal domain-containing protein [Peptococcaceae bacterium]|jgi:iron only hydrogenase large subunit-like protein|nr:iron hydrogenase [Peptococcaceae bacterium]MDH7523990.1 [Fe-Fe] hydrogenase large subunit C-terminal domain-containing protein [Peptococcaceae bacterium]